VVCVVNTIAGPLNCIKWKWEKQQPKVAAYTSRGFWVNCTKIFEVGA